MEELAYHSLLQTRFGWWHKGVINLVFCGIWISSINFWWMS